jgi:methyl-accepting chemotaxis protein
MLQLQFLLVNAHFTINLLAALVCFAVSWLYFDAWLGRHDIKESTKSLGFFLLSASYVVHSTFIEQSLLESPLLGADTIKLLVAILRIGAFLVLIVGQIIDPIQPLPSYRRTSKKGFGVLKKGEKAKQLLILGSIPLIDVVPFSFPILTAITAFLYLRRATLGLEFHLRTIGYSLFLLSVSDLLGLSALFRGSDNITLENLVAPFGPIWIAEHLFVFIFTLLLGRWVWSYLAKRLETQLFIIFNTVTLVVFLLTAIFFTSVSLANMRHDILNNLKTNVSVLQYTIDGKKAETLSDAQVIAQNSEIINAISNEDRPALIDLSVAMLLAKNNDFLVLVDKNGGILVRADDPEKIGGSLSDDQLVKKALQGDEVSGIITRDGVMAPTVSVRSAVPIKSGDGILGVVTIGSTIDNAFVDGLKNATGLDASIYADNIRSATTFIASDGKSRWIGIKEENKDVRKTVLNDGDIFTGTVSILNIFYLSAFTPIVNVDGNPIGMLFVGKPEVSTLQTAGDLIEQTFLVTVALLILSIFPSYIVSKYIIGQIR